MMACIFCIRKIDSWNVEVFFVVVRTCGLYKTLPASKIAKCPYDSPALTCAEGAKTRTHEEYQRFAAWSLERLVRNVHELAKNLSWNEDAARAAISTHNKKMFCCLFISVRNAHYIAGHTGSCPLVASRHDEV